MTTSTPSITLVSVQAGVDRVVRNFDLPAIFPRACRRPTVLALSSKSVSHGDERSACDQPAERLAAAHYRVRHTRQRRLPSGQSPLAYTEQLARLAAATCGTAAEPVFRKPTSAENSSLGSLIDQPCGMCCCQAGKFGTLPAGANRGLTRSNSLAESISHSQATSAAADSTTQ